ncbi:MAG TPA: glycosyltransferase [Terriglobales bacterium]|nr:glycosyltransferase [Terriglobales bacterium]
MIANSRALIITVNFRHVDCTLHFLRSTAALEGFGNCHLVIADNNSGDGSRERIQEAISGRNNVELLALPNNRGYFGAAKLALEGYLANHSMSDWVIVCNNDIVFNSPAFLDKLLAHDPHGAGVLAPAVISSLTGFDSNPMILHRPGRLRRLRYRFFVSNYYVAWLVQWLAPFVRKGRKRWRGGDGKRATSPTQIYAPHGSFLIFSRRYFEAGGVIDDGAFLYGEEIGVAETCRRLALPVIHDPALQVTHHDSQTTGRMLTRKSYLLQKEGLRYSLGKYLGSSRGA